eukprot:6539867-Alexandrium_andersonii.AAC.1
MLVLVSAVRASRGVRQCEDACQASEGLSGRPVCVMPSVAPRAAPLAGARVGGRWELSRSHVRG